MAKIGVRTELIQTVNRQHVERIRTEVIYVADIGAGLVESNAGAVTSAALNYFGDALTAIGARSTARSHTKARNSVAPVTP